MAPLAVSATTVTSEERRATEQEIRLRRLGRQIALARGLSYVSQADLGRRLGTYLDRDVPQTTISRWEAGQVDLGIEAIRAIEIVLDKPRGSLLAASGYVDLSQISDDDIESIIMTDPQIHPSQRASLLTIYRTFAETSRQLVERDEMREAAEG